MPSNTTNSENLISELNKYNVKIFGDIEKFLETYSAAKSIENICNDDTNDNNEDYIKELIQISNLTDQCKTEEDQIVLNEVASEEKLKDDRIVEEEEEIIKKYSFETFNQNPTIDPDLSHISSSKAEESGDLKLKNNNLDTSEQRSKSKLNYLDGLDKASDGVDNEIPNNNSKTAQALSVLFRIAHRLYHLFIPTSNFNSENDVIDVNDTTTTFINKNFLETDESIQESTDTAETSTITSNEINTQTSKQHDYYFANLQQMLYDPFTSIAHKSYCLKHGTHDKIKKKYPKISKDSCYEKAANIGNAIKKFEILIQEDQKQEFRFKSETMRRTALFYQKNKTENNF